MAAGDKAYYSDIELAIRPPMGRMVQTVPQTGIASNVMTAATFTTEEIDTHNFHDGTILPSRVTPTISGRYWAHVGISLTGATDYTACEAVIRVNGAAKPPAFRFTPSAASQTLVYGTSAIVEIDASVNDYFEGAFRAVKTAGTVATVISSQYATTLQWRYFGPLV